MKKNIKINSRGAISLVIAMTVLGIALTISLGTSLLISNGIKISSDYKNSIRAYYAAETGMEEAIYKTSKLDQEAVAGACDIEGVCPEDDPPAVWTSDWITNGSSRYYIKQVGCVCASSIGRLSSVQVIGEYKTVRRSLEISY